MVIQSASDSRTCFDASFIHQEAMQQQPVHHPSCEKYSNGFLKPFLGLALALLLLAFLPPTTSSCSEQERSSLLQFLTGLSQDGGLALSWQNGTADCCAWEGVGCGTDGTVTDVSLASKGLQGHISASLGELTGLLRLNLSHNLLSGGLPMELMSSNSIVVLDVSFNRLNGGLHELPSSTPRRPLQVLNISTNLFTGQFPSTTWEVMTSLVALNASNNSFTGQIPSHLCSSSPALAVIALCYNQLSGLIPPGLGNCSMLKVLKAGHNALSGSLPDELFNATSLEYLSFPNNGLHGMLDSEHIINLRNLAHLDLGGNRLNGNIPDSIGQLKRLEELHLNNNNMSGELPSTLSNCTNLITIDLKVNNFSGELQKVNFFNLPNLKTLDLLYNNFTGTIPESIYSCSNLNALRLSSNNLHGQLSPRIANLKHLVFRHKRLGVVKGVGRRASPRRLKNIGWVATLRGDIYSFGVVLLELLTGLRPVPVLSTSKELVPWVLEMRSQGKQIEVLDPTLSGTGHEEQMLMMLEGACKCVNHNPVLRPTIMEVVSCLESIDAGLYKVVTMHPEV